MKMPPGAMVMATTPTGGSPFRQAIRDQQVATSAGSGMLPMQAQAAAGAADQMRTLGSQVRTAEMGQQRALEQVVTDHAQGPGESARSIAQQLATKYRLRALEAMGPEAYQNLSALGQIAMAKGRS